TTWVLRGVGVTAGTEVGEETAELLVTKPLLVRPVAPRFFVVGDRAQLAALVSNNTEEEQEVEVTLHADGLALEDEAAQTVSIPAGGEVKVTWWVEVEDVEAVDVSFSAVAGDYSDAARPRLTTGPGGTLLVYRYTAPEIVGTGGQLVDEDARTEVIALPPKYDDRQGALSIRLDPSLAAGMVDGLDYLEHFPYECTEQIVSRFLPNVLTYRALRELGISDPKLEAKLPGLVEEGLGKLYLRQNGDGGWGWWHGVESNPHLTAYVVFALVKAQEAGFVVQVDSLSRGLVFLESELVSARALQSYREANQQAFLLYVMAEAGQTGRASEYAGDLFRRREKLSHYGRAYLALTLGLIDEGDDRIATLLSDLQNAAILSATGAHWEEANCDYWAMNTDTRSTAIILDALARLDPASSQNNALIPNVVRWLMVARQDGIWETTQETAWALIALTDWMVVTGELKGEYEYGAWLNDEPLAEGAVTPDTVRESVQLQVDVADLLSDAGNRLTIGRGPGEGRLYYTAHLKVYLPVEEIEPLDRGIIVSRRYIDPACTEGAKCPEVNEVKVGDVIQVRLTIIAPHDLYYVVVEDPLPAGAEAIDTGLATTSELAQEPGLYREAEDEGWYDFYYWWWCWYSRSEMRDDKVVLFAD
ncbi:MAG: alpha-2-macroglobulin family protein, partial [Chloroflexota bacterium]|nr:alpha-2-macroglobulin family protein [Chloroflexota bacterium]